MSLSRFSNNTSCIKFLNVSARKSALSVYVANIRPMISRHSTNIFCYYNKYIFAYTQTEVYGDICNWRLSKRPMFAPISIKLFLVMTSRCLISFKVSAIKLVKIKSASKKISFSVIFFCHRCLVLLLLRFLWSYYTIFAQVLMHHNCHLFINTERVRFSWKMNILWKLYYIFSPR